MRKVFKFMLAALIMFGTTLTVFALETGTITIDNAVKDETYTLYKIFDLESYDKESTPNRYAYKITEAWQPFFAETGNTTYVTIDDEGYVIANTLSDSNVAEFAKKALAYAKTHTSTITSVKSFKATGTTVTFDNLDLGYYLVDTTLGTLCSITTTDPEVTIKEKNIVPTVTNTDKQSAGTTYVASDDAKIGDTVNIKSSIEAYKGAEDYVLHTTIDDGLTLDTSSIVVKDNGGEEGATRTLTAGTDYTLVTTGLEDDEDFEIVFSQTYLDSVAGTAENPTVITVEYDATLNGNAVIDGDGNKIISTLDYSEGKDSYTSASTTTVYTWSTTYFKFYYEDPSAETKVEKPLADAVFSLSTTNATTGTPIELVSLGNNKYRVATTGDSNKVTTITTDATGVFEIDGLDSGTYYLIEVEAPDGFNKLSTPVTVKVESSTDSTTGSMTHTIKVVNGTNETVVTQVKVENKSGTLLPATGGMGTKLLLLIGSMLFFSTIIVLVTKKRMYNNAM